MQTILLRAARPEDASQVVELERASGVEVAFHPDEFHLAESDGRIVACARLRPFPDGTTEIASVAVDASLRGQGVGARLVREILSRAEGPVHALAIAPGFFLKLGFQPVTEAPAALREKLETTCASSRPAILAWTPDPEDAQRAIRRRYGAIAARASTRTGLAPGAYSPQELALLPPTAHLGLGTGNPVRAALLRPGETVVDLGSGAGVDVLLAARAVGPDGKAIGIDFTPAMVERARANAREANLPQAEFHLAPIESLPLPDASADVVVSNCVVNLSTDKRAVLREAYRVLRPGGRVTISDTLRLDGRAASGPSCDCTAGAMGETEWRERLAEAGFTDVSLEREGPKGGVDTCCGGPSTGRVMVRAVKPA